MKKLSWLYSETLAPRTNSFSLQAVLTIRNGLILKNWHSFSSLYVINFGHISDRIRSLWIWSLSASIYFCHLRTSALLTVPTFRLVTRKKENWTPHWRAYLLFNENHWQVMLSFTPLNMGLVVTGPVRSRDARPWFRISTTFGDVARAPPLHRAVVALSCSTGSRHVHETDVTFLAGAYF